MGYFIPGLIVTRSSEAVEAFRHVARWISHSISPLLDMNAAMCAALPSDEPWVLGMISYMYLLTRLVQGLTKSMPKTSTVLWKCIHISPNLSQHSRRSLMHMIVSLPPYDLFYYSIFIDYMRIYSYFPFIFQLVCAIGDARFQDTSSSICFSTNVCGCLPKTQQTSGSPTPWSFYQGIFP